MLNRIIGVRDTTPSWCVVRDCVWPGAPAIQLVSRRNASVQFPFPMQHSAMGKVLQADMQLSSRSPECWSSHDLSAMEGLTQSYMFKQKLLNCEPIDLSRFVVDLRGRHLEFWTPFSDGHPREAQQRNAYLSPVMRAACTKSSGHPSSLLASPHTCFLTFHEM